YIVVVRNTDVNTFFKYMIHLRKTGVKILLEASKVIFLSNSYKDLVVDKYIPKQFKNEVLNKSLVIPNGIDQFWLKNKSSKLILNNNKPKESFKVLQVGVIKKGKNQQMSVKVVEKLRERGYVCGLTLVGEIKDYNIFK